MIVVVMVVLVAVTLLIMIVVVMVMLVAVTLLVMIVVVMVLVAIAQFVMIVVVMVMMLMCKRRKSIGKRVLLLHCSKNIRARELIPRRSDYGGVSILLANQGKTVVDLLFRCRIGMRKNDRSGMLQLIIKEFTEILHIHLALPCINYSGKRIQDRPVNICPLCRTNNIGKLTDTRGLNDDTIGLKLLVNLGKRLGKITDERAAYTTGIHLGNINAGILQKSAVNTDLAEFVLNQHDLFTHVSFFKKLFNQRSLSRTEKSRKNIYFCHGKFASKIFTYAYYNIFYP